MSLAEVSAEHPGAVRPAGGPPAPGQGRSCLVGLIGSGIQASLTPAMHEREGDHQGLRYLYKLIDLDRLRLGVGDLGDLLTAAERMGFAGLNITHPCKQAVMPLLDELSPDAEAIGAVNTVVFRDGRRTGHNTDSWGFAESFRREMPDAPRDRMVLIGAGGAGAAVAQALLGLGTGTLAVFDVEPARAQALARRMQSRFGRERVAATVDLDGAVRAADGLVNATPIGMKKYPGMPVGGELLRPDLWVAEIVYFPAQTELVRRARAIGARVMPGGGMAVFQAVEAFRLFTGLVPDAERMRRSFQEMEGSEG